ncbi:MAG TPA: hypothetical protein EYQ50_16080 [Verrucomicrobiales bacterium]|nr:hypothetical protein [Verrucomicrobiales bacterium]HIL71121.1 hypothetical protein [Verrucomicrobiota bacterium]
MIFHHYFPNVQIECTELDEDVVEVAKSLFGIVLDHRLKVTVTDGRKYLEKIRSCAQYDILFVDAFRATVNSPFSLATKEFCVHCKRHLAEGGVFSVNVLSGDKLYKEKIATASTCFKNAYVVQAGLGASIFFGTDGDSLPIQDLVHCSQRIHESHGFVFPLAKHARDLQPIVNNGKIVNPLYQGRILSDNDPPNALPLPSSAYARTGRNDPCPCGSGKKFKKCHGLPSSTLEKLRPDWQ